MERIINNLYSISIFYLVVVGFSLLASVLLQWVRLRKRKPGMKRPAQNDQCIFFSQIEQEQLLMLLFYLSCRRVERLWMYYECIPPLLLSSVLGTLVSSKLQVFFIWKESHIHTFYLTAVSWHILLLLSSPLFWGSAEWPQIKKDLNSPWAWQCMRTALLFC